MAFALFFISCDWINRALSGRTFLIFGGCTALAIAILFGVRRGKRIDYNDIASQKTGSKDFFVFMKYGLLITSVVAIIGCKSDKVNTGGPPVVQTAEAAHPEFETLSIDMPPAWHRIPNDSFPQAPDMTAYYRIRTGSGDTLILVHGFSAQGIFENKGENSVKVPDVLFERKATKFRSAAGSSNTVGIFVDSVGEVKQVGFYGFAAYARGRANNFVDSFFMVVRTVKLHSL